MYDQYRRVPQDRHTPDWSQVNKEWGKLFGKNAEKIQFPTFLNEIKSSFTENPEVFVAKIASCQSNIIPIPDNFEGKSSLDKSMIFFSYFSKIFNFEELKGFVLLPDLSESRFKKHFSPTTHILFDSVIFIYTQLINSVQKKFYPKFCTALSTEFSKLLIPIESTFFGNSVFNLELIYISPCLYSKSDGGEQQSFIKITNDSRIIISNAKSGSSIDTIKFDQYAVVCNKDLLEFYNDNYEPIIKIKFPSTNAASIAAGLIIEPPPIGFNIITTFLQSVSAINLMKDFFTDKTIEEPAEYTKLLDLIIQNHGAELLVYTFLSPSNEIQQYNEKLAPLLCQLVGNRIYPFWRAVIELNWIELIIGDTVLRSNNPLSFTSTYILKLYAADYLQEVVGGFSALLKEWVPKLQFQETVKDGRIRSKEDAELFAKHIFAPAADIVFNSIPKMPPEMRFILRTLFIRTAGHYVNERANINIVPNLYLLRFVMPELVIKAGPLHKLAVLLGSSILSLFYMTGWQIGKDNELSKMNDIYMKPLFPKILRFTLDLIDVSECNIDFKDVKYSGPVTITKFFEFSAGRLALMNLPTPNRIISTHMYSVSVMQMIEEFAFDFTKLPTPDLL